MNKKEYVTKFINHMNEQGEMFVPSSSLRATYDAIALTLELQGYWAGYKYRYFFDDNLDLIKVEERRFGQ